MFLEKKDSGVYLAKKFQSRKFLVKVDGDNITKDLLYELTNKEINFIQSFESYDIFLQEIYHSDLLREVVFRSKLLYNYIDISHVNTNFGKHILSKSIMGDIWINNTFPKKFIYNSNNIEGSKIPEKEVEKIIENKRYTHKIKNEIQEVTNSIHAWNFLNNQFIFNEAYIKKLYHILTKDLLQENGEKYPRGFKKIANVVNNNPTTSPENVSREIQELIRWYQSHRKSIFPLQLAFDFHLKYEQIHPFENGNGRTGRLLMNKILIQNGMLPMIVFTENKQSYFRAIASCSSGSKKKYYKFMLEQYQKTLSQIEI